MTSVPSIGRRASGYRQPLRDPVVYVGLPRTQMAAVVDAAQALSEDADPEFVALIEHATQTISDAIRSTDAANVTGSRATSKAPTRSEGGMHDDWREEHPAYGMIGAAHISMGGGVGGGVTLFGSDAQHHRGVKITLKDAEMNRGLSSDRPFARRYIAEVVLSEAQWATFVSTPNVGDGVPCTVQFRDGMQMPAIEPIRDTRDEFHAEYTQTFTDALDALKSLREKAAAGRPGMADIRSTIDKAIQEIEANVPFVAKQFDDHIENTVEKAKIEVHAWMTDAINRAGLQALGATAPIELADPQSSLPSDEPALVETDGDEAGTVTR